MMKHLRLSTALLTLAALPASAVILHDWNFSGLPDGAIFSDVPDTGTVGGGVWVGSTGAPENFNNGSGVLGGVYRVNRSTATGSPNSVWVDLPDLTSESQQVWAVIEIAGWNLFSDSNQTIRFGYTNGGVGNSTIAGQVRIDRSGSSNPGTTTATLYGEALGNGTNSSDSIDLSSVITGPLSIALRFDKASNQYEVSYLFPGFDNFVSLGTADIDPARIGNALRLNFNNSFGGEGEFVDISRIYVTTVQPIPEPSTLAALLVGLGLVGWMVRRRR